MPQITFNAFSFLLDQLTSKGVACSDAPLNIPNQGTINDVLKQVGLSPDDVEGAFVNGRVSPFDTLLKDGDRVALIPPGTPGPYRVLLNLRPKSP